MSGICIPTDLPRVTGPAFLSSPCCYARNALDLVYAIEHRGQSTLIPHVAGRVPNDLLPDEFTFALELIMVGDVDASGTPRAGSTGAGLQGTLDDLVDAVVVPGRVASAWTVTMPDGSPRTALVQVTNWKPGETVEGVDWLNVLGMAQVAVLNLRVNSGGFA